MKARVLFSVDSKSENAVVRAGRCFSALAAETTPRQQIITSPLCLHSPRRDALQTRSFNCSGKYGFKREHCLRPTALNRENSRLFSTLGVPDTNDVLVRADFWGEPITFFSSNNNGEGSVETAVAAMDDFCIAVASKGGSCSGGGDDEGVPAMSAHSSAIVWAECLRQAAMWHESAPMMAVAAVSPLLTHANIDYLWTLDSLIEQAELSGVDGPISLLGMAKSAVAMKHDERLTEREISHLVALDHLLRHDRREALDVLLTSLQQAPGDALALCLSIDLAHAIGDRKSALRAAGFVATYWQERGERGLRPALPGYSLVLSWIALGFAAGGRYVEAERMAEKALYQDGKSCGGVATCALAHVYDAEGRTAEAISKLAGDGVKYYDGSGLFFFDGRIASYGARFLLDREGLGEGRSPLRMYDTAFVRVMEYSGYDQGRPWTKPQRRAPRARSERMIEAVEGGAKSFFGQMFGGKATKHVSKEETTKAAMDVHVAAKMTLEDVLTWLPPTPQLLTDASFLLVRLTINGSVSPSDYRWTQLANAWTTLLSTHEGSGQGRSSVALAPLALIAASLTCPRRDLPKTEGELSLFAEAFSLFGKLLSSTSNGEATNDTKDAWASVTKKLSEAVISCDELDSWDIDFRPIVDQIICYSACKSEDAASLCIARSFSSLGVALRPNCPEEWYRYGMVLEKLGDHVAAEDARAASVSLGAGEGGAGAH